MIYSSLSIFFTSLSILIHLITAYFPDHLSISYKNISITHSIMDRTQFQWSCTLLFLVILRTLFNLKMSISEWLQGFRGSPKVVLNQKYIDNKGAKEVAKFLQSHSKVELLELKSNDISGIGFAEIFKALLKNPSIRQIIIEHNKLGEEGEDLWPTYFDELMRKSTRLDRLNFSNNKINARAFNQLKAPICNSKSLKLLEIRYNQIPSGQISSFLNELERASNQTLLYVELAGNKIERDVVSKLDAYLKNNKEKNPIPKDNLLMTGGFNVNPRESRGFQSQSNFSRTNAIDDLSKENVLRHLEDLLDQSRRGTVQLKNRLEEQLIELQKRQKLDADEILDLDRKCNQITISNRNLNYQVERTLQQHKQIELDHEYQARVKQERIHEANRQLHEMQTKYEQIENKMNRDHEARMKEVGRVWEARLRSVQQKIRDVEAQSNTVENQIVKQTHKRQKLRVDYEEEQSLLRSRIEEEQTQRYRLKLQILQSRLAEVQASRQKFYKRAEDIIYEFESNEHKVLQQIEKTEQQLEQLKVLQKDLVGKNKDFVNRNEMIKQDITRKQIAIEKYEEEINRINQEIEHRKIHNSQQIDKIIEDHELDRVKKGGQKQSQIQKLNDIEAILRNYKLENARLQQDYKILEHKLQIALSKGVQEVFAENNLY